MTAATAGMGHEGRFRDARCTSVSPPIVAVTADIRNYGDTLFQHSAKDCHRSSRRKNRRYLASIACTEVARPRGFEPLTFAFGGQRSIQLSYGRFLALDNGTPPQPQPFRQPSPRWRGRSRQVPLSPHPAGVL
jgi:hypothetical protein